MSSNSGWKYVDVRRLFIHVEESIEEGTQWVVFELNHEPTWAKVVRSITSFLTCVRRNGGLQGVTQDEAFFVKSDRTTMTQDDIDNGRLIAHIGIAPVKPAEFIIFRTISLPREQTLEHQETGLQEQRDGMVGMCQEAPNLVGTPRCLTTVRSCRHASPPSPAIETVALFEQIGG